VNSAYELSELSSGGSAQNSWQPMKKDGLAASSHHHKIHIHIFTKQVPSSFLITVSPKYLHPLPSAPKKEEEYFLVLLVLLATLNFHVFLATLFVEEK
jgi:hypothetical protein